MKLKITCDVHSQLIFPFILSSLHVVQAAKCETTKRRLINYFVVTLPSVAKVLLQQSIFLSSLWTLARALYRNLYVSGFLDTKRYMQSLRDTRSVCKQNDEDHQIKGRKPELIKNIYKLCDVNIYRQR